MISNMKKTLILILLAMLVTPLWAQRTYGELTTDELRQAANQGDATAQSVLGIRYEEGDRVTKDYQQTVYWFTKAANQGHSFAQISLAEYYYEGKGIAKDCRKALYWYEKVKAKIGVMDEDGAVLEADVDQEINDAKACIREQERLAGSTNSTSQQPNANSQMQTDAKAQYELGFQYYVGNGVAKDLKKAVQLFAQAANQGYAEAQYWLGYCYLEGEGVAKDPKQAVHWFTQAANQGNVHAQYFLGSCYYNGKGVDEDPKRAIYWYTQAANQDNAAAQYSLGGCYYNGKGVDKDCRKALEWYRKAQANGFASASISIKWAEKCIKEQETTPPHK